MSTRQGDAIWPEPVTDEEYAATIGGPKLLSEERIHENGNHEWK